MADNEVSVNITVEEKQALKAIASIIKSTDKMGTKSVKDVNKLDAAMASFKGNLAAIGASRGIDLFTRKIGDAVDASKQLEVFETQFKTILGSTTAARDQLKELQDFAANTPFQLPGLALSTRQLLSFGVAQKNIIPTLQQLGDLAAGTGANIDELTIPFGRLISTQKLTLIELDKFADRGINLYQQLADKSGISIKSIRDEISKGRVPFELFTESLGELTGKGGTFYNAMQAQSQTLSGVLSTLGDNFFNLEGAVGDAFKPALIEGAKELTVIVQNLTAALSENGPQIAKTIGALSSLFVIEPAKFWSSFFFGGEVSDNLQSVNVEIEKLDKLTDQITARVKENKDNTIYNSFFGKKGQDLEDLASGMERLTELKQKRDAILKERGGDTEAIDPKKDSRVVAERQVFDEIAAIRAEQALAEQETEIAEREQKLFKNESELQELRDLEMAKLEIKKEFALEKASFIIDEQKKEREIAKINAKFELDAEKLKGKQALETQKRIAQQEKTNFNTRNQAAANFFQAGLSIAKEGSAAHRVLATADAIRQTYVAANNALATPAPYPLPIAFAASTVALGLANVAKINSFETGGVIGGFNGASLGRDNTIANVRNGEMVLTGSQQKQLFTDISNGGGGNSEVLSLLKQMVSTPISVSIDGREIARANRTAIEEGFAS